MVRKPLIITLIVFLLAAAGAYYVDQHIAALRKDQQAAKQIVYRTDISVTIIEGKRREEIAAQLAEAGVCSYDSFMAASQAYEGQLFPDTYRFFPNTAASEVVSTMVSDFKERTSAQAPTQNQLILASIVEREAANPDDAPTIAGVYQNRLNIGMALNADPTVQYSKDSVEYDASPSASFSFWKAITQDDYHGAISPYNTYLHTGLPPGAISNPGLVSIQAAEHPAIHSYLYFLYKDGKLLLSKTLEEHELQDQ